MTKAEEMLKEWEVSFSIHFPQFLNKLDHKSNDAYYYPSSVLNEIRMFVSLFINSLIGFKELGWGFHSTVYRHGNDVDVLKISNGNVMQIYFTEMCDALQPDFLGYNKISNDGNCATQMFVDCDMLSQRQAHNLLIAKQSIYGHVGNVGLYKGRPVIIDPY